MQSMHSRAHVHTTRPSVSMSIYHVLEPKKDPILKLVKHGMCNRSPLPD